MDSYYFQLFGEDLETLFGNRIYTCGIIEYDECIFFVWYARCLTFGVMLQMKSQLFWRLMVEFFESLSIVFFWNLSSHFVVVIFPFFIIVLFLALYTYTMFCVYIILRFIFVGHHRQE